MGTLYGDGSDHGQARVPAVVGKTDADYGAERAARFRAETADTPEERGALVVAQLDRELAAARSRSGTRLTEAQRSATCERPESLKVRLRPGYRARLVALAERDGFSASEWVEVQVEFQERELAALTSRRRR